MTTAEEQAEKEAFLVGFSDEQRADYEAELAIVKRISEESELLAAHAKSPAAKLMQARTERMALEAQLATQRSELIAIEKQHKEEQARQIRVKAAEDVYQREAPKHALGELVRYDCKLGLVIARCPDPGTWLEWQQKLWKADHPERLAMYPGLIGPKVIHPSADDVALYGKLHPKMWEELYWMIDSALSGLRGTEEKKS